ncbi:MAG: hypothetical protein IJN44_05210 [Clostridia bacterium]|nr:hypothetical protein [Clostridia bacterium]
MIYSYCKHCKAESPGDTCQTCGKRASAAAQRNVWSASFLPLTDSRTWKGILLTLVLACVLCFLLLIGLDALLLGPSGASRVLQGNLPALIFSILPLGLLIAFLFLYLQGRETLVFVLDPRGAHLQTWHEPSRKKSWARLQTADASRDVPNPAGSMMHLSQERHMLWQDVQSVQYKPHQSLILLYHTPHCAPMVLRLPQAEYEMAAAYVSKHCKGK